MSIFSTIFHTIKNWFAPNKASKTAGALAEQPEAEKPSSQSLLAKADDDVVSFLRKHPDQLPPGVTLPPEPRIQFSFVRKSPKAPPKDDGSDIRFDLADDEPPPRLADEVRRRAGSPPANGDEAKRHRSACRTLGISFSSELMRYVNERFAGQAPAVYRAAHLSRQAYSAIISDDDHRISRGTALALVCALHLAENDAEAMLQKAGYALSDALLADVIYRCCLRYGVWDLDVVNKLLEKYQCRTLP
ncbi:MAG: hypothetical protein IKS83_02825 [Victivallales bacterium]|nr:hypothetical protein [Victivallales bacterium]